MLQLFPKVHQRILQEIFEEIGIAGDRTGDLRKNSPHSGPLDDPIGEALFLGGCMVRVWIVMRVK